MQYLLAFLSLLQLAAARFPAHPLGFAQQKAKRSAAIAKRDVDPSILYPAHNFTAKVDNFHNESMYEPHSCETFPLRYWFDDTYYKPGGPVFVLESGEVDASTRLPYIQKGILYILSKATGGMSVVIEHRYFGTSFPTADLSTENLRFCTTDQALADTVNFAKNVVFKGHEHENLNADAVPWIAYGGSYAGAFVAFLRTLYPGVFYGAISSSGVTKAIWNYWEYYEPIRQYAPQQCVKNTQLLTNVVDNILIGKKAPKYTAMLKKAFGLSGLEHSTDFANAIAQGIGGWQSTNWDPAVNAADFDEYCGNITSTKVIHPATTKLMSEAKKLITIGGHGSQADKLTTPMLNYIGYINQTVVQACAEENQTQYQCFSNYNITTYQQHSLADFNSISWPYMYCTQWGFLQTGSGVPKDQLPLISRTLDLDYESLICKYAFNMTTPANTTAINQYGGYDIAYPRLANIGGQWDPWRPATPLAPEAKPWHRVNDSSEPFLLIADAVHHWDENGLFPNQTTEMLPPEPIKLVQGQEVAFVKSWLEEAKGQFPRKG
ncbi:MAG: hypothetical protein M1828_006967 [Chrysothrix sp. TS-e1954]|nr:MAG: hypothetical protein M1828_006967 [Chrysothrix sp. TS-e1954]